MSDLIISSPDESGWYWYRPKKNKPVRIAFVNDDGLATTLSEDGEPQVLDDLIGLWEKTGPDFL